MTSRTFPILRDRRAPTDARRSVPWAWVALHEAQARRNHDQSLERLAERGGLSPAELLCVVHGKSLREIMRGTITAEHAERWLASWDGQPGTLEPGWTGSRCSKTDATGRCTLPSGHEDGAMDVASIPRECEFRPFPEAA